MTYPNPTKAYKLDSVLELEDFSVVLKATVNGMPDVQKIVRTFISDDGHSTYFMAANYLTCKIEKDVLFWDTVNKSWFLVAEGGRKIHVVVNRAVDGQTCDVDYFQLGVALSIKRIHNNSAVGALPNLDERYPGMPAGITISEVLAKAPSLEISFFSETTKQLETIKSVEDAAPWIKQLEGHESACVLKLLSGNRNVLRSLFLRADPKTDELFLNCAQAKKQTLFVKRADCVTPLTTALLKDFLATRTQPSKNHDPESKQQQNPEAAPAPSGMSLADALTVAGLIVKVGRVTEENGRVSGYKVTWNEAISVEPASAQDMPNARIINFRDGNFLVATDCVHIHDGVFPYLKNTVTEKRFPVIFEYLGETVNYGEVQELITKLKYNSQQPTSRHPTTPPPDWSQTELIVGSYKNLETKHSPEEKSVTASTTQRKLDEVLMMENIQLLVDEPNSPHHGERIIRTFIPQPAGEIQHYIVLEKHAFIKLANFNLIWHDGDNQWSLTDCRGKRFTVKVVHTHSNGLIDTNYTYLSDVLPAAKQTPSSNMEKDYTQNHEFVKGAEPPLYANLVNETLEAIEKLVVERKKATLTLSAPPTSLLSMLNDPSHPVNIYSVTKSVVRDKKCGSSVKVQLTFGTKNGRLLSAVVTHKVLGKNEVVLKRSAGGDAGYTWLLSWD